MYMGAKIKKFKGMNKHKIQSSIYLWDNDRRAEKSLQQLLIKL